MLTSLPESNSIFIAALVFATERHRHQRRKGMDHLPYVNHLVAVVDLLWRVGGVRDPEVLAAAFLHDTVEDTDTKPEELERLFGARVRSLVMELTDDRSLPSPVRKRIQEEHAASLTLEARAIKLADKISNVDDVLHRPPFGWSKGRRQEYVAWAGRVVDRLRGDWPALEAEFDRLIAGR